jgi:uncharacterized membrane protein YhaH (DUF805 family)
MTTYQNVFADPRGRTSARNFMIGLILVLLAAAFYYKVSPGLNGQWVIFTLLFPAFVLHARRLHDMGQTAWLTVIPGVIVGAALLPQNVANRGALQGPLTIVAAVVFVAFAVWCVVGKSQDGVNKYGEAAPA